MKSTKFVPAALLCCGALFLSAPASADHPKDQAKEAKAAATTPAHDAMMAEMMKNATPGKEHEVLKSMGGKWKATIKAWGGPGEPTVSQGTMDNDVEFGGRMLTGKFKGDMMGMPMEGLSLMGFDNKKQQYWSFWADNMSTAAMMMYGTGSADGKTITLKGSGDGMDGKPTDYVMTTKLVDADTHVFTMESMMGGKMTPMMEITYNRNK
jgi:hypothetical protein